MSYWHPKPGETQEEYEQRILSQVPTARRSEYLPMSGAISNVRMMPGVYIDLSVAANRKFVCTAASLNTKGIAHD